MGSNNVRAGGAFLEIFIKNSVREGLATVRKELSSFASLSTKAGLAVGAIGTIGVTGFALGTDAAREFQLSLLEIQAATGKVGLGPAFKQLAVDLRVLPTEIAKIGAEVARSFGESFTGEQIIQLTGTVAKLAKATKEDSKTITEAVRDIGNAFGTDNFVEVSDILLKSANSSSASVGDLAESFKFVAPVAAQMGVSLRDAAGALAALSQIGIKGSEGGTSFKRLIVNFRAEAAALSQAFNVEIDPNKSIADGLSKIGQSLSNKSIGEKAKLLRDNFELLGIASTSGLVASEQQLANFAKSLANVTGETDKQFSIVTGGIQGSVDRLKSSLQSFGISVGLAIGDGLGKASDSIANLLQVSAEFVDNNKELVTGLALSSVTAIGAGAALVGVGLAVNATAASIAGYNKVASVFAYFLKIKEPDKSPTIDKNTASTVTQATALKTQSGAYVDVIAKCRLYLTTINALTVSNIKATGSFVGLTGAIATMGASFAEARTLSTTFRAGLKANIEKLAETAAAANVTARSIQRVNRAQVGGALAAPKGLLGADGKPLRKESLAKIDDAVTAALVAPSLLRGGGDLAKRIANRRGQGINRGKRVDTFEEQGLALFQRENAQTTVAKARDIGDSFGGQTTNQILAFTAALEAAQIATAALKPDSLTVAMGAVRSAIAATVTTIASSPALIAAAVAATVVAFVVLTKEGNDLAKYLGGVFSDLATTVVKTFKDISAIAGPAFTAIIELVAKGELNKAFDIAMKALYLSVLITFDSIRQFIEKTFIDIAVYFGASADEAKTVFDLAFSAIGLVIGGIAKVVQIAMRVVIFAFRSIVSPIVGFFQLILKGWISVVSLIGASLNALGIKTDLVSSALLDEIKRSKTDLEALIGKVEAIQAKRNQAGQIDEPKSNTKSVQEAEKRFALAKAEAALANKIIGFPELITQSSVDRIVKADKELAEAEKELNIARDAQLTDLERARKQLREAEKSGDQTNVARARENLAEADRKAIADRAKKPESKAGELKSFTKDIEGIAAEILDSAESAAKKAFKDAAEVRVTGTPEEANKAQQAAIEVARLANEAAAAFRNADFDKLAQAARAAKAKSEAIIPDPEKLRRPDKLESKLKGAQRDIGNNLLEQARKDAEDTAEAAALAATNAIRTGNKGVADRAAKNAEESSNALVEATQAFVDGNLQALAVAAEKIQTAKKNAEMRAGFSNVAESEVKGLLDNRDAEIKAFERGAKDPSEQKDVRELRDRQADLNKAIVEGNIDKVKDIQKEIDDKIKEDLAQRVFNERERVDELRKGLFKEIKSTGGFGLDAAFGAIQGSGKTDTDLLRDIAKSLGKLSDLGNILGELQKISSQKKLVFK